MACDLSPFSPPRGDFACIGSAVCISTSVTGAGSSGGSVADCGGAIGGTTDGCTVSGMVGGSFMSTFFALGCTHTWLLDGIFRLVGVLAGLQAAGKA